MKRLMVLRERAGEIAAAAKVLDESRRQAAIEASVRKLTEAERLAAQAPRLLMINYRVKSDDKSAKGARADRYAHLVALIRALEGEEVHLATSAWIAKSRRLSKTLLADLAQPLDAKLDFLSVTPILERPTTFGDAGLEA